LALSGCLDPAKPPTTTTPAASTPLTPAFEKLREALADLPCKAAAVPKDATSANMRALADLRVENPGTPKTLAELDRQGDLLVQAFYTDEGFRLINLSDPQEPEETGRYLVNAGSDTYDVKFSRRQPLVVVGFSNRMQLVDVSVPASPKLLSELKHPAEYRGQAHMIYPHVINGTEYLFVGPSISGTGLLVAKIVGENQSAKLELVKVYASTGPHAAYPQALAPHDTFATYDATYGHHLLYIANSFNGIVIMEIDDPADAKVITSVPPQQAPPPTGALPSHYHTIQAQWISGKRILVTVGEVGYNTMKVFDATDLRNVKFLAEWVHDRAQAAKMQHNLQIVNGTLFMGHYEHGLYVFDLQAFASAPTSAIVPVAHYQPPPGGLIWDVVVWNGLLLISDIPQGLHVVAYGCFKPGDASLTSQG
jgi:hypothetical protein